MDQEELLNQAQKRPGGFAWLPRAPFAVMALGGIFLLLWMKWDGIGPFYVMGAAVGLLLFYAGCVFYIPNLRIREDQLGDNCYYLGFLYTLASLGYALYVFAGNSNELEIIANFGVALASTIVGILLRVFINQLRRDVLEVERDARIALTESVVNMRVQLNDATIAMRAFCKVSEQITADAIRDNALKVHEVLETSVKKVAEVSTGAQAQIGEAFRDFSDNSKKLNQVSGATVKAIEALLDRIEKIDAPSDLISRRLEPILMASEKAAQLLRGRLETDEQAIIASTSRMAELEERLKDAGKWIAAAGNELSTVGEAAVRAAQATETAAKEISTQMTAATAAVIHQVRIAEEAKSSGDRMLSATIDEQRRLMELARSNLESLSTTLTQHNDGMATELERTRRMAANTGESLADLADTVARRIAEMKSLPVELRVADGDR